MKHRTKEQAVGHDAGSAPVAESSPREPATRRNLPGRAAVSRDPAGRVAIKTAGSRATLPAGYSEADLCAYAHHVWIQLGMPCTREAWDEAKACLDANLPLLPSNHAQPAGGRTHRPGRVS